MNRPIPFYMAIMAYSQFKQILNQTIFEKSKADLLEKIASSPSRYIGLFRPTKPKAKILQNLLQSHEIRFGDALELVIEEYLKLKGCKVLEKRFINKENETLYIDQCFKRDNKVFFIEQKVRDDHDSTKKRGQIENFEKKLNLLLQQYPEKQIVGVFYFIDPNLKKNEKFYSDELSRMKEDYNVEIRIDYGESLFNYLGYKDVWEEILLYLEKWKKEVPDLPEINFDLDAVHIFNEIKDLEPFIFRKLFSDDELFSEILLTIFPKKTTLKLLQNYFKEKDKKIYTTLADLLDKKLSN